jgi:hypothetical protein
VVNGMNSNWYITSSNNNFRCRPKGICQRMRKATFRHSYIQPYEGSFSGCRKEERN